MTSSLFSICILAALALSASAQTASGDSDPVLTGSSTYSMPQKAVDAEIGGKVVMGIELDETGTPRKAWLVSGPAWPCGQTPINAIEELSSSLSTAMKKLRFSPALKGGKPIAKDIGLTIDLVNPALANSTAALVMDPVRERPLAKTINGGVVNGKALSLPRPAYPAAARVNREGGTVTVQVLIDEQGNVLRAGALNGPGSLQFASRAAACEAKFSPTLLQGSPVKVSGVITYNFRP